MTQAATPASRPRAGRTAHGRRRVRSALALAAMDLFASQGFEATTVDQIADAAGVGRRTFFRYFRSKEDVVFPGHDERLAEVVELLEAAGPDEPPLAVVCRTAEVVLDMYLSEPEVSLKRFALTRQVPALRDKEIASIDRYQRVFARYLRSRLAADADGDLRAAVIAASVVAVHNHVLREWLRSGGAVDAPAALREALGRVREALSSTWDSGADADEHVVVGVVRTGASPGVVLQQLEDALRGLSK
ncbi:TetR family transcriptional regulator [Saccharopolyspora erythraea]|uniref:TetR family transcriptional regulator n=1 Tax=Saccharopolyspora erythraea TaxID=1836 RepID=UPI001BA7813C|nr:TetR family transcriptional regulator [Saccharopolyspora erythraea]QUH02963.1 TetR family transcriptional regulator [Saccharopolyspora erythraea]